jgi:hypothetical protein
MEYKCGLDPVRPSETAHRYGDRLLDSTATCFSRNRLNKVLLLVWRTGIAASTDRTSVDWSEPNGGRIK